MNFIHQHALTLILFLPLVGALSLFILPKQKDGFYRWTTFAVTLLPFFLTLYVWFAYSSSLGGFQFQEQYQWYEAIHSSFHLGVDGISLPMVLLTTLLTPLAILASFNIKKNVRAYMALFLMLETGMLGVFLALDLLLFFVFWEIGLVPMYFLIASWGSDNRNYASLKFILYTMAGSLGLLLAIQLMGVVAGTFDLPELFTKWVSITQGELLGIPVEVVKTASFWAFVIAFAIKVPIWPFHTWLPDAHTEAPTAGSMILAGVLLKLGAYGFLRLVLPLFPQESQTYSIYLAILAAAAIIFGAWSAFGQTDFKRLVAYSSINHMGFVVLGIAAAASVINTNNPDAVIALNGVVLQMFNHGLSAAGMFFLVGVLYERLHTRDLTKYGGLFAVIPIYGGVLIFTAMASLGLPGLNGFVSEYLVVRGTWPIYSVITAISMIGLFFTGAYILKALKMVLHGPLNAETADHVSEMNIRELVVIAPLMLLMLWIGVWPAWLLTMINQAVVALY